MPYADELLVSGETVLRREKQHWILPFYIAGKWVAIAVAVTVISFLVNWILVPSGGGGFFGGVANAVSTVLNWITAIALLIAIVGFVVAAARWQSQEYVLTSQRVIHVRGVISKKSSDSVLESISDARIDIPFLGRMMHWGNLVVMTANESGNERMLALRDPVAFKGAVFEAKTARMLALNTAAFTASTSAAAAAASGAPAVGQGFAPPVAPSPVAAAPAPATPSPAVAPAPLATGEELTRTLTALASLRDSGAITAEEYEAKKTELLGRI